METKPRRNVDETWPKALTPVQREPKRPSSRNPGIGAYAFLDVTLDLQRELLIRGSEEIRLRPRTFDVLAYLVENSGRLMSKQELIDAVWADVAVTDDSLVQCLIEIRRALGSTQEIVKTVRGRGYLFDCGVRRVPIGDPTPVEPVQPLVEELAPRTDAPTRRDADLQQRKPGRLMAGIGVAGVVSLMLLILFVSSRDATESSARSTASGVPATMPVRFTIDPPPGTVFGNNLAPANSAPNVDTTTASVSPDGSHLAFVAVEPSGQTRIWLRSFSDLEARPLAGTEGAGSVFWSPDGRSVAFPSGGKLKRLDLTSGTAVALCDVPEGNVLRGTWGADHILFQFFESPIFRVSTAGGSPVVAVQADASAGETMVGWPWFLPDGRRFLYFVRLRNREGRVMLADGGKPAVAILSAISNVQWVDPDYLVFAREGTIVAQRFDVVSGRPSGDPLSIAGPVLYSRSTARAEFSASLAGVLVYQSHSDQAQLVWFNRAGSEVGRVESRGDFLGVRISPDGRRALFARATPSLGTLDMWAVDLLQGFERRLTSDSTSELVGGWLGSGKGVVFSAERGGPPHLFFKDLDNGAEKELLPAGNHLQVPQAISPDGIVAFSQRTKQGLDVWTIPLAGPHKPVPLLDSKFNEGDLRFSPDGKLVSFVSDETGQREVYVAAVDAVAAKRRVSIGGGAFPRWSRNGRELFYLSTDRHVIAVAIKTQPTLDSGTPVPLFRLAGQWPWTDFDVAPDGRLLAVVPQRMANQQPLTVILNWPAQFGHSSAKTP